jgi:CubicO group peptidase (beta-lactamase class C family)
MAAAMIVLLAFGSALAATPASTNAARYPWNAPACPCNAVLHVGAPADAGLVPHGLNAIDGTISRILVRRVTPGAVVLVARRGVIAKWQAYGYSRLYKNANFELAARPIAMRKTDIFDMASVSKLFTAVAVMQLWDQGKFKLDDPVAKYLPGFGVNGKQDVTIKQLLTHTSGFRPDPPTPLYDIKGSRADRLEYVLRQPLEYPPGTHYVYSDINFIVLGALIEKLSGEREDAFVREHITKPLHMRDTMYDPPAKLRPRIAATEYQPWTDRGMLWGEVNDENAWALGGVAGHAGVFSSAHDLAVFGQMMLNQGSYDGARVLSRKTVKLIETDWNKRFPGNSTGLGWSINRDYLTGALSGPHSIGHEGYTGTELIIDTANNVVAVFLTNREHPTRHGPSVVTAIRHVYTDIANAIPVAVPGGGKAWFAGYGDYLNRALTAEVKAGGRTLSFTTWYRTQPDDDFGIIEASPDSVHWSTLGQLTGSSGGWQTKKLALPANTRYIRFDYRTDAKINGRGWYVNDARVDGRPVDSFSKTEWVQRDF